MKELNLGGSKSPKATISPEDQRALAFLEDKYSFHHVKGQPTLMELIFYPHMNAYLPSERYETLRALEKCMARLTLALDDVRRSSAPVGHGIKMEDTEQYAFELLYRFLQFRGALEDNLPVDAMTELLAISNLVPAASKVGLATGTFKSNDDSDDPSKPANPEELESWQRSYVERRTRLNELEEKYGINDGPQAAMFIRRLFPKGSESVEAGRRLDILELLDKKMEAVAAAIKANNYGVEYIPSELHDLCMKAVDAWWGYASGGLANVFPKGYTDGIRQAVKDACNFVTAMQPLTNRR